MSIRPTIRSATVAGAVAALSLSLLPALATSASAVGTSPNVAFTFMTRHNPLVAGDGAVKANAPGDLTSAPTSLLPAGHYVYSFDVSPDGNTAAYLIRTTDSRGDFFDTSSGLVVVHRNTGTDPATITARRVATWVDTNPVVSTNGDKVWWMTGDFIYEYNVSGNAVTTMPEAVNTAFKPVASNATFDEYPSWLAVSEAGSSIAVLYDRYSATTGDYYGSRVLAAPVNGPTTLNFTTTALATDAEVPSSSTFVFTAESRLLYSVNLSAGGFSTRSGEIGTPGVNAVTAGVGAFYQVDQIGSAWYFWKDDAGVSYVGESTDPGTVPTEFFARTDGDSTVRYVASTVVPPAVPNPLDSAKSTFTAFLNLDRSAVTTGGKAYFLAGGQSAPVGPDPFPYGPQQNFKGTLQYSLNGTSGWTNLKITTGAVSTGPGGGYNGLTQALSRNTWFRWIHPADLFTDQKISPTRKVSVRPTISISKAKSGTKTRVYGKIARTGGTAVLYKRSSTGSYVKVASATISSTGSYSFGYRSLSRGTYRVFSVASTYWASNYKNFTI